MCRRNRYGADQGFEPDIPDFKLPVASVTGFFLLLESFPEAPEACPGEDRTGNRDIDPWARSGCRGWFPGGLITSPGYPGNLTPWVRNECRGAPGIFFPALGGKEVLVNYFTKAL